MKKYTILFSLFYLSLSINARAQFQGNVYLEDSSVKVIAAGKEKTNAWCGGLNNPQFSVADLNHDGLKDLVIFQPDQAQVTTYINVGTPGNPDYRYRPQYIKNFPPLSNYLILKDYNRDGIADLFHMGTSGFSVYKGFYNAASELSFDFYQELFYSNNLDFPGRAIRAYVNIQDIPAIVDVDNDGDLDFLSYSEPGMTIYWYCNMQVEDGLPTDSIRIKLKDNCWGKTSQFALRQHELGFSCSNGNLAKTGDPASTLKRTDAGNIPCLLDIDGDGDYDALDGHRAFNTIVFLKNGRTTYGGADSMVYQDSTWITNGDTVQAVQWPAAFHLDMDQDGIRDLMVSPNARATENYKCAQFYKNIGTDVLPSFKLLSDTFLIESAIDQGSSSYPFFYDYDKDGKPDLFLGSKGYYEASTGVLVSRIKYFKNTSSGPGHPSFELISEDFLNLAAKRYKGLAVGIGDVDNDGLDDLLLGHTDGSVDYVRNSAGSASVQPQWLSAPVAMMDNSGSVIGSSGSAVPVVYDMNKDGKNDIVIGDVQGFLFYYQNTGSTPGVLDMTFTNNSLGNAVSDPDKPFVGGSTPYIGKMDNTGIDYLMMGSRSGRIFRYTGFQAGVVTFPYTMMDSAYSNIFGANYNSTFYFSAPAFADVDGDGNYEMVLGNIYGGLFLYKQSIILSIDEPKIRYQSLKLYPNPAKNQLFVGLENKTVAQNARVKIFNSLGQLVREASGFADPQNIRLDISDLQPAVYFCVLSSDNQDYNAVFVKRD